MFNFSSNGILSIINDGAGLIKKVNVLDLDKNVLKSSHLNLKEQENKNAVDHIQIDFYTPIQVNF